MGSANKCVELLGANLKDIVKKGDEGVKNQTIDLQKFIILVLKSMNRKEKNGTPRAYMSKNTLLKEITFLNGLNGKDGITVSKIGVANKDEGTSKYPAFKFDNIEAVKRFIEKMRDCRLIINSFFCFAGSKKLYVKMHREISEIIDKQKPKEEQPES